MPVSKFVISSLFNRSKCFQKCLLVNSFQRRQLFFESHPKTADYKKDDKHGFLFHVKNGWKLLGEEFKLFAEEMKEKFENDPVLMLQPGVVDKIWSVKTEKDLDKWMTTCDSDHGEGFSSCEWTLSPLGHGLFCGNLQAEAPKDGKIKRAGYCSVRTLRARKSFKRKCYLNWSTYTHIVVRLRGDGRSYMLNIATSGFFDNLWNDVYHYTLYTRGGPYWQVAKIPFSKFFFSSKGQIQDIQTPIELDKITNFGITAADKINGEFSLEIDYIGLEFDPLHEEETAYEMYRIPKYLAAT